MIFAATLEYGWQEELLPYWVHFGAVLGACGQIQKCSKAAPLSCAAYLLQQCMSYETSYGWAKVLVVNVEHGWKLADFQDPCRELKYVPEIIMRPPCRCMVMGVPRERSSRTGAVWCTGMVYPCAEGVRSNAQRLPPNVVSLRLAGMVGAFWVHMVERESAPTRRGSRVWPVWRAREWQTRVQKGEAKIWQQTSSMGWFDRFSGPFPELK